MADLKVLDIEGKEKEKINIDDNIVNQDFNTEIIYQEVRRYLASLRSGTHKTKERSEVSGGGKKPWRQKGTGNARAGSIRSPIWRHGGTVFGPKPRDYSFKLNKKVIRKSRLIAFAEKFKNNKLVVLEELDFKGPKTKEAMAILNNLKISGSKILLILESLTGNEAKSFRNIPGVAIAGSKGVSTYDILNADYLIFTKNSFTNFIEVFSNEGS